MAKIPDISKLASKIDVDGIVKQVRDIVNPGVVIPDDPAGNPLHAKIKVLHTAIEKVNNLQMEQAKAVKEIKSVVAMLYEDVKEFTENSKNIASASKEGDTSSSTEASVNEPAENAAKEENVVAKEEEAVKKEKATDQTEEDSTDK